METEETRRTRFAADLERRRHYRLECEIRGRCRLTEDGRDGEAVVRNLGLGGARVEMPFELPIPCAVELVLPPLEGGGLKLAELTLPCNVAWTTAEANGGLHSVGLQFANLDARARTRICDYLYALGA